MTFIVILILAAGVVASIWWKKLTVAAAVLGGVLGGLIYAGDSYRGLLLLAVFFILGTLATSWKKGQKQVMAGESGSSRRTAGQVFANGGVAALAGIGILIFPAWRGALSLAMGGSLAAATADTLSSELGMIYGKRVYHILTWKSGCRGEDGMVSIEGLLIGVVGSMVIAGLYVCLAAGVWSSRLYPFLVIVLAGFAGNLVDSILGAVLERRGILGNNAVNFFNTLAGAMVAALLSSGLLIR